MREISVDLPALGKPTSPTSAKQFQFQAKAVFFAGLAVFVLGGRLMGGGREARVAAAAAPAVRDYETIAGGGEVVQQFAGFRVVDDGADRAWELRSTRLRGPS